MRISNLSPIVGCLLFAGSSLMLLMSQENDQAATTPVSAFKQENKMQFGNFSVSLTVKDIKASQEFYEKLDFVQIGGNVSQNWLIMQNGTTTIGLFHGMFEKNLLTFNPGWNHKSETLPEFQDVRDLQAKLKERGIVPATEADPATTGPANFVIVDPDGNPILVDQHVPKGK
jgi:lactoylglutathione lyase